MELDPRRIQPRIQEENLAVISKINTPKQTLPNCVRHILCALGYLNQRTFHTTQVIVCMPEERVSYLHSSWEKRMIW